MMLGTLIESSAYSQEGNLVYPSTKTVEQVDDFHGTKVEDPYRWLEDDVRENKDVAAWVAAQNEVTFGYLKSIPQREVIQKRMTELWNYEKIGAPFKRGGRYYFSRNDGLQNQNVLFRQETLESEPVVLLDPNSWSKDGTVALSGTAFSDDGRYVAYGVQKAGSDWNTWKVMEIESGKVLDDELNWVKFSGAEWTPDSRGFFYARYPEPKEGAFTALNTNMKVYYHRVGTPQSADVLVYERPDHPDWGFQQSVSEDGHYLIITVWVGTDDRYRIVVKDLTEPYGLPWELISNFDHEYSFVGNDGSTLYFKTNLNAPNRRVIAIDLKKPAQDQWKEIIPETENAMESVGIVGNMFVCSYLKDAKTQVRLHAIDGSFVREVEFPGIGTAGGFDGRRKDTDVFYSFSSFALPPTTYRYNMITGESKLFRKAEVKFNPDDYETKQVFYTSKDGTKVPMFITHKKGLKLDGSNPTLLYGYGGFNISVTPSFSVGRVTWMEMGGVYAVANLRGGGEYGERWHKAGTKQNKQNVFDDFISAAEWLIANKYTSAKKLAIQGRSNGGLLIGACMTQRPDLFGACLPGVGVMDMLRFHKFTAGRFWTDDYGSADVPEEFPALLKYSPYHNLKGGVQYPATLITTADTDDRVVPGHSFKFAAQLQASQSGTAPTLIRIETSAGHGAGKPTAKIIEEASDEMAFLVKSLGMK
ncbi:MAG: S9 family peptidase [Planctomycetaceae bacterium]|nr:S9 family peptidase [Planctomycetaceae bacterium]